MTRVAGSDKIILGALAIVFRELKSQMPPKLTEFKRIRLNDPVQFQALVASGAVAHMRKVNGLRAFGKALLCNFYFYLYYKNEPFKICIIDDCILLSKDAISMEFPLADAHCISNMIDRIVKDKSAALRTLEAIQRQVDSFDTKNKFITGIKH